jgi:hypothetical protein
MSRSNISPIGNTTTGENLGTGCGVFYAKTAGNNLEFLSLVPGAGVSLSANTCSIKITSTGSGGIVWNGSTANGVVTYGNATTADVETNLTFDGTQLKATGNLCTTTCVRSPLISGSTTYGLNYVIGAKVCGTTCVGTPILSGSTCSTSPLHCGACTLATTCLCSPVVIGSTCSSSPLHCGARTLATTCLCSPVVIGSTCSSSPLHCGACTYATTIVCSPIISGSTKICSPIVFATSCVSSPIICATLCICATDIVLTGLPTTATENKLLFLGTTGIVSSGFSTAYCNKIIEVRLVDCATNTGVASTIGGDFRVPYAMCVRSVGAYVDVAGTTNLMCIDIKEAGTSIMTTTKITIDSGEKTSTTAATCAVLTDTSIAADAIITYNVTAVQSTPAKGLTVWMTVSI